MQNTSKTIQQFINLLCAFTTFVSLSIVAPSYSEASEFLHGFEDIPIMSGMEQIHDNDIFFDTPAGRIVETYTYTTSLNDLQISDFYTPTLSEMGWKKQDNSNYHLNLSFIRENETLTIGIIRPKSRDRRILVHYKLSPIKSSNNDEDSSLNQVH
ncbi:MAG: hypothetical protein GY804_12690 [Alphaproteobacteria bacterium]|nr:hypothetical protein [Alphaproteobacteria bacterium]